MKYLKYLYSDFGCINWHNEKFKCLISRLENVATVYLMTSSTVVSSDIKRHLYFSSATCRHMSYEAVTNVAQDTIICK